MPGLWNNRNIKRSGLKPKTTLNINILFTTKSVTRVRAASGEVIPQDYVIDSIVNQQPGHQGPEDMDDMGSYLTKPMPRAISETHRSDVRKPNATSNLLTRLIEAGFKTRVRWPTVMENNHARTVPRQCLALTCAHRHKCHALATGLSLATGPTQRRKKGGHPNAPMPRAPTS